MKVALCLHGFAGGKNAANGLPVDFQRAYDHYQKHILSCNDVDVFMHTWNPDLEENLRRAYRPAAGLFEKMVLFDASPTKRHGVYSRWCSFKKAVELKSDYERRNHFTYDCVMVARFDLLFFRDVRFSEFDMRYFYAPMWDGDAHLGVSDLWFFANSRAMDAFAALFDSLDEYLKTCELSNHVLARHHLEKLGLLPDTKFVFENRKDFVLAREHYRGAKKALITLVRKWFIGIFGEQGYLALRSKLFKN